MRALVVDDSRAMRMILKKALVGLGFDVTEVGDGLQALAHLEKNEAPDLALLDWNMPGMNGYELLCALRSKKEYDRLAIMMVTTESDAKEVQRAIEAGANEYVMKPFTSEDLREKLLMLGLTEE